MTLPNRLTVTRLFMTPLVFLSWYLPFHLGLSPRVGSVCIWILFIVSEITDILDGHFARSRSQVSDVGKLMDPFSDVFLRITYFICFVGAGIMPIWTTVIIAWRELAIMFIRMLLAREGTALAANRGGKMKSLLYFLSGLGGIIILTLRAWTPDLSWMTGAELASAGLFVVAALASLISFIDYFRLFVKTETFRNFVSE